MPVLLLVFHVTRSNLLNLSISFFMCEIGVMIVLPPQKALYQQVLSFILLGPAAFSRFLMSSAHIPVIFSLRVLHLSHLSSTRQHCELPPKSGKHSHQFHRFPLCTKFRRADLTVDAIYKNIGKKQELVRVLERMARLAPSNSLAGGGGGLLV